MSEPTPPTNTPSDTPVHSDAPQPESAGATDRGDAKPERVEHDLTCLRCGFNLRTLPIDADCPECGLPVNVSLQPFLSSEDAQWLTALTTGMRTLGVAMSLGGLIGLMSGGALALTATTSFFTRALDGTMIACIMLAGGLPCAVLAAAGAFMLSGPRRTREAWAEFRESRRLVRHCLAASAVAFVLAFVSIASDVRSPSPALLFMIASLAFLAGLGACVWSALRHTSKVAHRIRLDCATAFDRCARVWLVTYSVAGLGLGALLRLLGPQLPDGVPSVGRGLGLLIVGANMFWAGRLWFATAMAILRLRWQSADSLAPS